MGYKVLSRNTAQYLDLHDCVCKRLYLTDSRLVLEMEWIEVLAEHPENPFDRSHQSGEGVIEFENVVILEAQVYDTDGKATPLAALPEYSDIEINYLDDLPVDSNHRYACIQAFTADNGFLSLEFIYSVSRVMWNELNGESWFEEEKWSPRISFDDILKMLSWNAPEEVQQKGLALAEKNGYSGLYFLPMLDGKPKDVWENCARVISCRTDEELAPHLIKCFVWLQDVNFPGARHIAERLRSFGDTETLLCEKEKALKIARLIGDEEWAENLSRYI